MLTFIGVKPGSHARPLIVIGITAEDFAGLLAGGTLDIDPVQYGLPSTATITLLGDTTGERILARLEGSGAEVTPQKTDAEAAAFVKEHVYGKNTH